MGTAICVVQFFVLFYKYFWLLFSLCGCGGDVDIMSLILWVGVSVVGGG